MHIYGITVSFMGQKFRARVGPEEATFPTSTPGLGHSFGVWATEELHAEFTVRKVLHVPSASSGNAFYTRTELFADLEGDDLSPSDVVVLERYFEMHHVWEAVTK